MSALTYAEMLASVAELVEPDNWLAKVARLDMARVDRGAIRYALRKRRRVVEGSPDDDLLGIELRVNPWMPEGIWAAFDGRGDLLGLIDTRGDHDPSRNPAAGSPDA